MALDIRVRRFRRAPLLHAARKGVREAARASGPRSRARVRRCRCSCCRCVVRAAVPVLRNTDRSCGAAAQDIAGDYPRDHPSRDDRPDGISDIVSYGVPDIVSYGVPDGVPDDIPDDIPDRFTFCFCDGVSVRASQPVSEGLRTRKLKC